MDVHSLLKNLHAIFTLLAVIVFLIRAVLLFRGGPHHIASQSRGQRIALVAMQHLSYTVVVITGGILLYQNHFVVQPWFYAKIVLFLVALSASQKAFSKRDMSLPQRKAGVVVAGIAFASLLALVHWKPQFMPAQPDRQPVQLPVGEQAAQ